MLAPRGPRAGRPPRRRRLRPQGLRRQPGAGGRAARRGLRGAPARRRAGRADGRLGHARFAVAGHDRGARVAYRMALDRPGRRDAPGGAQHRPDRRAVRAPDAGDRRRLLPWILLAQPPPFAERLLAPSADWSCGARSRRGWPAPAPSTRPRSTTTRRSSRRRHRRLVRGVPGGLPPRPPLDAADRAAGRDDRVPRARALGRRGDRSRGRPRRLAPLGRRRPRRAGAGRPLRRGGGAGRVAASLAAFLAG